jgi:hypothetical protein
MDNQTALLMAWLEGEGERQHGQPEKRIGDFIGL